MPIPSSHMKERLSLAYVGAIAARAGVQLSGINIKVEYGIDGRFQRVRILEDGGYKETGYPIQIQVKASTTSFVRNGKVVYDMEAKDYNKLIDVVEDDPPTIFVLFRIPPEEEHETWLTLDDDQLAIKKCCYWDYITGPPTTNTSKRRIEIPVENRLTPEAVLDFFRMLKEGKI